MAKNKEAEKQKLVDAILDVFHRRVPTIEEFGAAFATVVHVLGCTDGHAEEEEANSIAKAVGAAARGK
jgi:hypothetical protein